MYFWYLQLYHDNTSEKSNQPTKTQTKPHQKKPTKPTNTKNPTNQQTNHKPMNKQNKQG